MPRRLRVMLRARLHADERGFTMIEMIVAIGIIATALTALAYTATNGFRYASLARQKQTATGIANQIMERARGLAWDRITAGHLASDLNPTTDPNIVTGCGTDAAGVYRFLSCMPNGTPGSGEKVVALSQPCPAVVPATPDCVQPLVRHTGMIDRNGITYTWRTYDTNDCPTAGAPGCTGSSAYRMTVIVTWTGGRAAPNKLVQVQSLFWSPKGCQSTSTHPFAAPCQPFFFAEANVPRANININGTLGVTPVTADLYASGVESSAQQEQLSQVQGSFAQSGVELSGGDAVGGKTATASAADTDPGTAAAAWSEVGCGLAGLVCAGGSVASTTTPVLTLTAPSGETATSDSTISAGGSNVCPPPPDTAETDARACGASRVQQGGSAAADAAPVAGTLGLDGLATGLGNATVASIGNLDNVPNKTFVNRVQYTTSTTTCSPTSGADGCLDASASRSFGTIGLGGLPSGMTPPPGWNGYWLRIAGYAETLRATVGRTVATTASTGSAVSPPSAPAPSGTISYWNGAGYTAKSVTDAGIANLLDVFAATPFSLTQSIGGKSVTVRIGAVAGSATPASTSTPTTVSGSGSLSRTSATAQITPPHVELVYTVDVAATRVVDLRIVLNLKNVVVRGSYAEAPTGA